MRSDDSITPGISIVCVYNDLAVRRECLDRSIEAYVGGVDVDYVAVDNTTHAFSTAGAALNHGARKARHELVAFVHQDVYLHSINRLVDAGVAFKDGTWGLLGANGVTSKGENVGRLRDRAQVIGAHAPSPVEVDSVDEVLFMAPRDLVLNNPISEDGALAWHAYAVEYGLRHTRTRQTSRSGRPSHHAQQPHHQPRQVGCCTSTCRRFAPATPTHPHNVRNYRIKRISVARPSNTSYASLALTLAPTVADSF